MTKFDIIVFANNGDRECPTSGDVGGGGCPDCEDW